MIHEKSTSRNAASLQTLKQRVSVHLQPQCGPFITTGSSPFVQNTSLDKCYRILSPDNPDAQTAKDK